MKFELMDYQVKDVSVDLEGDSHGLCIPWEWVVEGGESASVPSFP